MASVMSTPAESPVALSATKLLIDNRWITSESGKTFATVNPSTGEEICQIAEADAAYGEKTPVLVERQFAIMFLIAAVMVRQETL